jgi:hypothetical protein
MYRRTCVTAAAVVLGLIGAGASAQHITSSIALTPPTAGSLSVAAVPVPYVGSSAVLGHSKNLDFARMGNRWYKMTGDHTSITPRSPDEQGGRQEILSFNGVANDWRLEQPYYIMDATQVQFAFPDDTYAVGVPGATPDQDEIWVFPGPTNHTMPSYATLRNGHVYEWFPAGVPGAAKQVYGAIMAWKPSTKRWRIVNDTAWPQGLPWRGFYDPRNGVVVVPGQALNGTVWFRYRVSDGADVTPKYPDGSYVCDKIIAGKVVVAGAAVDFVNRLFYVYDHNNAVLYRVNLDFPTGGYNDASIAVRAWPETPMTGDQGALKMTWDPDIRAVVYAGSKLVAYQPATNQITVWNRPDGYLNATGDRIPTSTLFYDPDTKDVMSIGGIDWNTPPINSSVYWRLQIH